MNCNDGGRGISKKSLPALTRRLVAVLGALVLALSTAKVMAADAIRVALDPNVRLDLANVSSVHRKDLEKSIATANRFLAQLLDQSAYSFDPGYVEWSRRTGQLVAMSGEYLESEMLTWSTHEIDGKKGIRIWLVCPQATATVAKVSSSGTSIEYELLVMATELSGFHGKHNLITDEDKGRRYRIRFDLNKHGKIVQITLDNNTLAVTYGHRKAGYEAFLRKPYRESMESASDLSNKVERYRTYLRMIAANSEDVCKPVNDK